MLHSRLKEERHGNRERKGRERVGTGNLSPGRSSGAGMRMGTACATNCCPPSILNDLITARSATQHLILNAAPQYHHSRMRDMTQIQYFTIRFVYHWQRKDKTTAATTAALLPKIWRKTAERMAIVFVLYF